MEFDYHQLLLVVTHMMAGIVMGATSIALLTIYRSRK